MSNDVTCIPGQLKQPRSKLSKLRLWTMPMVSLVFLPGSQPLDQLLHDFFKAGGVGLAQAHGCMVATHGFHP